jgi:hypothetical protein
MQFIRIASAVAVIIMATAAKAQNSTGSITGRLVDTVSKQPLALATVTLFTAGDTSILTYRMSGPDGSFTVPGLPVNKPLRVIISYSGFGIYKAEFVLGPNEKKALGVIGMSPDSRSLEEILIVSERPPVIYRKDTIEFNASAFLTLPTALVEDLLKKLPGVSIDGEGNIRVNERKVNRLMVDGKDFFGSDPRMATRNLPANIIDKVQVMEDKDEAQLNPDKLLTELGQVINLKLKKGIKKGWFGKAYAGAGTDRRHELGSIVNLFRDTLQVSLIGFSNNLDRAGFRLEDIRTLGGFDRSGLLDYTVNERGLSVNGTSFGGQGEGISKTSGGGMNVNHVWKNGLTLNTQYFFGRAVNTITEIANQQQFLKDTIINNRSSRQEVRATNTHRIGLGLRGQLNSNSRLEFKSNFQLADPHNFRNVANITTHSFDGLLNENNNYVNQDDGGISYSHALSYFKSFRKKGRHFSLDHGTNYNEIKSDLVNTAITRFYSFSPVRDSLLDQLRRRNSEGVAIGLQALWDEPITERLKLRINYSLNLNKNTDSLATLNKSNTGKYDDYNGFLSTRLERTSWRHSLTPTASYTYKTLNLSVFLNLLRFDIFNNIGKGIPSFNQHFQYALPGINFRWKYFSLGVAAGVSPPGITDLQPVPDNTNPLSISYGNPNLKPTQQRFANVGFVKPMPEKLANFATNFVYSWRDDAIVRVRTIKADGVQESRPINVNGIYSVSHSINYRRQHKYNNQFNFFYGINLVSSLNRSYLFVNNKETFVKNLSINPGVSGGLNWRDIVEANFNYSYRRAKTFYEPKVFEELDIYTSSLAGELIFRWPKHFVFETQLNQRYNSQAPADIQKKTTLWNAAVNYLFSKDERAQLKLSVYDILKRNNNIFRLVSENIITDRQVNMLTQYFLLTFTYNIRAVGTSKVGGRQKLFNF